MKCEPSPTAPLPWRRTWIMMALAALLLTLTLPAAADEVNLALGKTVTPLTNIQLGAAANVVDGDYETVWYSYQGQPNQISFTLDLESVVELGGFRLQPSQTEGYFIESSIDGITWELRYTETDWVPSDEWRDERLRNIVISEPYQARYLRYTGTNEHNAYVGVLEFEVYGVAEEIAFEGGDGSVDDPWQISTAAQLNSLRNYLGAEHADKHFVLINDIDLDVAPYNEGSGWDPIGSYAGWEDPANEYFSGSFDGGAYTISGLFINRPATDGIGLFGCTDGAVIEDLQLANVNITGDLYVGGLVGFAQDTTIANAGTTGSVTASGGGRGGGLAGMVIASSTISGSSSSCTVNVPGSTNAGGLVGQLEESTIEDSFATGAVTGAQDLVAGLVGEAREDCSIIRCYATGNVAGDGDVGGLVGDLSHGSSITDSYATGTVDGTGSWRVGSLVGRAGSSTGVGEVSAIRGSFATGAVTGLNDVGGLVGRVENNMGGEVTISDCYATGNVTGTGYVAGLIGESSADVTIANSYAAGAITGSTNVGGLAGSSLGSITSCYYDATTSGQADTGKGEGLPTAEMKQQASFVDWTFPGVWKIAETFTYPYLSWQSLDTIGGIEVAIIPDDGSDVRGGHILTYGPTEDDKTTVQSKIPAPTTEEAEGEQQVVTRAALGGARAVVATEANGESRTWYEVYDDENEQWQQGSATLPGESTFAAGSLIVIEEGADGLQMRIETTVTDELRF